MTTADGSQLSDLGKVQLTVKADHQENEHPFSVAEITNEGILGTDFLRMHGKRIDFVENKFLLDGQAMQTCSSLEKNKCYRVSLVEKTHTCRESCGGSREGASRHPPTWQLDDGGFVQTPGRKYVLVGRSLVKGGRGKVDIEIFYPSEEDVTLNRKTHSFLMHAAEVKEDQEE